MIKKIMLITVALSTGTAIYAAPPRNQEPPQRPDDRRQEMVKPAKTPAKPQNVKPQTAKPAPAPKKQQVAKPAPAPKKQQVAKPAPAPAKPVHAPLKPAPKKQLPPPPAKQLPPPPTPVQVVTTAAYNLVRNTYTIQLNPDNSIIFEQRYVGIQELRDKIRMVRYDHPTPHIRIKVVEGVAASRLNFALDELKKAGFKDVEIIRINRRAKFVPQPRHPAKRIKR